MTINGGQMPAHDDASARVRLGVFLPVGNHGYWVSSTSPAPPLSFESLRDVTETAERHGFDYCFSMSKWRGFGGRIGFWDETFESLTTMVALAAVTERVRLIATVSPPLLHPAVAAKMLATADHVASGRLGINIVTGASVAEYEQMGILPAGYDERRYDYAADWLRTARQLWTHGRHTSEGGEFQLSDCVSSPAPVQAGGPFVVCAGTSPAGLAFTAEHADWAFLAGRRNDDVRALSAQVKERAGHAGRGIETATPLMVVLGDSDRDAQRRLAQLQSGADEVALANIAETYGRGGRASDTRRAEQSQRNAVFALQMVVGGAERVSEEIASLTADPDGLDSVMLAFPDYVADIATFAAEVAPRLRSAGVRVAAGPQA